MVQITQHRESSAFRNHQHSNVILPVITFLIFFLSQTKKKNHSQHVPHLLTVTPKYMNVLDALQALNLTGSFDFHLSSTISHLLLSLNIPLLIYS